MKVFISWSGDTSRALARCLRDWIPGVVQAARPYFTPDDVVKGSRWSGDIARELAESSIGIICLTRDNLEAPWLMFEAGALAKNLDRARVCPLLFGLEATDIKGPLVHFQAAPFGKQEMRRVVGMINQELRDSALKASVLDSVFEMWWPRLEEAVDEAMSLELRAAETERAERDILEEVLSLTRALSEGRQRSPFVAPAALHDLCQHLIFLIEVVHQTRNHQLLGAVAELLPPARHIVERLCPPEAETLSLMARAEYLISGNEPEPVRIGAATENGDGRTEGDAE